MQSQSSLLPFHRIGLFTTNHEPSRLLHRIQGILAPHGAEVMLLKEAGDEDCELDLVIAVGGDGTVLSALVFYLEVPLLAINAGTVGFLTAGDLEDLDSILGRVFAGRHFISKRSILKCTHPHGTSYIVNEMVVRGATRLITVELSIDQQSIRKIRGDGVIVGTATGSTAYLLAAGSPIVMPELRCMIVSGLNEYDFRARHLVVTHDSEIHLRISSQTREQDIYLSIDGKNKIPLAINDEIMVRESKRQAQLVFLEPNYFFHNLASRLSWGGLSR